MMHRSAFAPVLKTGTRRARTGTPVPRAWHKPAQSSRKQRGRHADLWENFEFHIHAPRTSKNNNQGPNFNGPVPPHPGNRLGKHNRKTLILGEIYHPLIERSVVVDSHSRTEQEHSRKGSSNGPCSCVFKLPLPPFSVVSDVCFL